MKIPYLINRILRRVPKDQDRKNRALLRAAKNGHNQTVATLLNGGANVNATDIASETPLHQAAMNGHNQTVASLLNVGANVDATNIIGETPLHLAARNGHNQTVRGLQNFVNETQVSQTIEAIISAMDRETPHLSNQNNIAIEALTVVLDNRYENGSESIQKKLRERHTNIQNSVRNNPKLR